MRIVFATTADLGALNGPSVHLLNMAGALAQRTHFVTIIAPRPTGPLALQPNPVVAIEALANTRRWGFRGAIGGPLAWPALLRHRRADAVIVRASPLSWATTAFCRAVGFRRVLVEANGWMADDVAVIGKSRVSVQLAERLQRHEARLAHGIRCVTEGLRQRYIDGGIPPERVVHIGNGTDLGMFKPLDRQACRQALQIDPGETVLAFAGNLWPAIDIDIVFEALAHPHFAGRHFRLVLIGAGPDLGRLAAKADGVRRANPYLRIDLLGNRPQADVNLLLSAADVALAPFRVARNERIGLSPLKIRDYAAAGCPIVASKLPGIDGEAGWLWTAEPENAAALVAALLAALTADRIEAGRLARTYAERHYGWGTVASTFETTLLQPLG